MARIPCIFRVFYSRDGCLSIGMSRVVLRQVTAMARRVVLEIILGTVIGAGVSAQVPVQVQQGPLQRAVPDGQRYYAASVRPPKINATVQAGLAKLASTTAGHNLS